MNKELLIHIAKLIFKPKDQLTRLALGLFKLGLLSLLGGWGISIKFTKEFLEKNLKIIEDINVGYQKYTDIAYCFGSLACLFGLGLWCYAAWIAMKDMNRKDIVLISAFGFENIDPNSSISGLSYREKAKILPLKFPPFDSRNKENIIHKAAFLKQSILERTQHSDASQAYIISLGSVPYLFMIGSFMRDGHLPLKIFDFDRTKNYFHPLDEFPTGAILLKKYRGAEVQKISSIQPNDEGVIGLAISFTMEIQDSELPESIIDHTLHVELSTGFRFDNLPAEEEQGKITKELSYIISELKQRTSRVDLFISAQASFILRLGTLYQEGLHGVVTVWHWNPSSKSYEWSLSINGNKVD
ncbi:SAVED domain-containing protein [Xenorhabdus sp. TH1]|uniref:SAVED domain-containing protein n=1 Tax=Xenorhabdus sp. TH1 TaxID=3130166 RepID=UPI0030CEC83C